VPGKGYPYLYHISLVAMEIMTCLSVETHDEPDLALQCAILHDTIEDTGCAYIELESVFGAAVARGVQALSKKDALPPGERMLDSLERYRSKPRDMDGKMRTDCQSGPSPLPLDMQKMKFLPQ
jgi:(p)ppGpp synthase/HD superfamily hydrolase